MTAHSEAKSGGAMEGLRPALVFDILYSFQKTAALRAAVKLGVFRAIGEGHESAAEIAKHAGASERGVRILCDFLVINGLLEKVDGKYRHTPSSAAFLDPASPSCLAKVVEFTARKEFVNVYENLAEVVKKGRTELEGEGTVEPENPLWVEFAEKMAPMMGPMAGPLGQVVLQGSTAPMKVLDIAAGHGLFGIELAKQNPNAHVTGLDWAPVLRVAIENAKKAGVSGRYDMLPGSAFDVEFGGPYDVVLLTNFLHHFDFETCVGLLKKIKKALKPGGTVATLEFMPNEDRVTPPAAAAFSLIMLATTAAGDAYTFSELSEMHRRAGYTDITAHPIPESPHTIVKARA